MARARQRPLPLEHPKVTSKFTAADKVYVYLGGKDTTPVMKLEKVPGVVKRQDEGGRVAVLVFTTQGLLTTHVTEERRIIRRGDERFATNLDCEVDRQARQYFFGSVQ